MSSASMPPRRLASGEATHEARPPAAETRHRLVRRRRSRRASAGQARFRPCRPSLPSSLNTFRGPPLLQGRRGFCSSLANLPITNSCSRRDVTAWPVRDRTGISAPEERRAATQRERQTCLTRSTVSAAILAGAVATALASMAAAAPLTEATGQGGHGCRARRSATASRSRGRTTAPPGRARPARAPRPSTTRAMPGSSSTAAPARRWSCPAAARARPSR